jgi:hypothetical protein
VAGWLTETYDIVRIQPQITQRRLGIFPRHVLALALRAFEAQAVGRERFVGCCEPGGGFRVVGQQEEDCYCREQGGQAFEDEEPAPGAEARGAVHVADAVGDGALRERESVFVPWDLGVFGKRKMLFFLTAKSACESC